MLNTPFETLPVRILPEFGFREYYWLAADFYLGDSLPPVAKP
jgi:hypothetical protein